MRKNEAFEAGKLDGFRAQWGGRQVTRVRQTQAAADASRAARSQPAHSGHRLRLRPFFKQEKKFA